MHTYILKQREREIIKRFIESCEKLNGFTALIHQLEKHEDSLYQDFELIKTILKKVDDLEEIGDEVLRQAEERRKTRLRTRGPYRKAHIRS